MLDRVHDAITWGRYPEAMRLLNQLIDAEPHPAALLERGRLYLLLSNESAALADFRAASAADPTGAIGDTARSELLKALTPAQPPAPALPPRPTVQPTPPHGWVVGMVIALLILSFICAAFAVIAVGRRITLPAFTPTPLELLVYLRDCSWLR